MNSSAKILFTLVAAGALGAVAIACTVGSGTVDDTDGGSSSGASGSTSGSTSSGNAEAGASSSGSTSGATSCTTLTYPNAIDSQDCNTCLEQNCCAETSACWNVADVQGGAQGCLGYATSLACCDGSDDDECYQPCNAGACDTGFTCTDNLCKPTDPTDPTAEEVKTCKGFAKSGAATGVPAAYDTYLSCRVSKCASACPSSNFAGPDAGAP